MSGIFQIAGGKVGSAVNRIGNALGNPLPDWGWTERRESAGSIPLTTQQRIEKSIQNTGGIAEGDYATAVNMGFSPTTPTRADGGILTPQQMAQNSQTVNNAVQQNQTPGDGQILGASDQKNPSVNPGPGYFWDAADGWKKINDGGSQQPDLYAQIGSVFDDVLGGLGGQQSGLEENIRSSADLQRRGINEQLGYGVQNLDTQRGNVRTEQANTLADLAQSLRDQARNVNNYLGARGVGGSANEAASFALQKLFGKERAGVQRQSMAQLGEIDMAETNLRAKASEMLNGVDTWANSQMSTIAQQFNELRNNIGMMKGQMRAQAIESLYNQYNQVESMRQQYAMNIAQAAQDRLAQLNNLKIELQGSSNFDPREMVYNEYGFNPNTSYAGNASEDMFNPLALAKRRQQQQM